jgi:hypothetical protein
VALILGGGGLMAANVYASATDGGSVELAGVGAVTIDCPDVGNGLTSVPEAARPEVDRELALLDEQIAAAYRQLQDQAQAVREDNSFADNAVMNPLKEKRGATIQRIADAIDRAGDRPEGLEALTACTLRITEEQVQNQDRNKDRNQGQQQDQGQQQSRDPNQGQNQGQNQGAGQDQGKGQDQGAGQNGQGNGGQAGNGPVAADYADITTVQPAQQTPDPGSGPSRGTFVTSCGVNANGLFNSDNVIVAPVVTNGAHHFHDYVGNQSNNAFASDDDLAKARTSCVDQGDKSTYYWPVLRLQNGAQEQDAGSPGGGIEGNAGEIVTPKDVTLTFVGNPRTQVAAMPRLLRIITGDAKAFVNGPANANASWSCTGFEDRQLKDKYPLCPAGSDVVRTFHFQSCWDGANIDSANHRTHVAFAATDGSCPAGFKAVPQLVQRIVYDVDAPSLADGGRTTPLFAVDSFPEQLHKPVTDHGDFINVFDDDLMRQMVDCINTGRTCGAGTQPGSDDGAGNGNGNGNGTGNGSDEATQEPSQSPEAPASEPATNEPSNNEPATNAPATNEPASTEPSVKAATSAPPAGGSQGEIGTPATAPEQTPAPADPAPADPAPDTTAPATTSPGTVVIPGGTQPQAVQGGLAETGANLWPAAGGGLLVITGFVVLWRNARRTH